ncbi:NAD(P) transhydrogenase subunit alpha [Phaeacidiphilus oryzae]|uniref:NAD(P) transhydrogenase subunit alpha n=1 Tax=Phaeacidiphilus oryzae TaxID=348818 RepID=UPI000689A52C|nr:NAD(P) transhydrogenase subunit alpha [Phaeacidiphilus oryzae]
MDATVGVVKERAPGERRVALVPQAVPGLLTADAGAGATVLVESGAGDGAWLPDEEYREAGAEITSDPADLVARADVLLCVRADGLEALPPLRGGQLLIGLLDPARHQRQAAEWAERGVLALSLDRLPRQLSRAQSMDALTSQSSVAGYKAAVLAAHAFDRFFPMLTTAAGTTRPAAVLVLGTGIAGLQAIATARRLGAVVTAYDVRAAARAEAESLGARFLDLGAAAASAAGSGGYARELTAEELAAQQRALDERTASFDVVITTAQVPGRTPPVLVTERALAAMRPGSVLVDLAASEYGGNVELSEPERTIVLPNGVTVIGAGSLPSAAATAASTAYARNLTALLRHLTGPEGKLTVDPADEITGALLLPPAPVTEGGPRP